MTSILKDKWYNYRRIVLPLCIIFFPVGLYGIYKSDKISSIWKIIGLSMFTLFAIISLSLEDEDSENTENMSHISYGKSINNEKEKQLAIANKLRRDSFQSFIQFADSFENINHYKTSTLYLDSALTIFPNDYKIIYRKGLILAKRKQYTNAIQIFESIDASTLKSEKNLEIGRCYLKLGNKEDAVIPLYIAMNLGNEEAHELYDIANPMIKEITGYRTLCCDGTISYSTGRGTCSHHGGVCKWNDPIYKTRRKYTISEN